MSRRKKGQAESAPVVERKVPETIRRHGMLRRGDRVLVACSGGADSVALLHLLCRLRNPMRLDLSAMHLNHRLRGAESHRDERFVRGLCHRLEIPLVVESADIAGLSGKTGRSVEECARDIRYDFFHRCAGEEGVIATAHTRSDTVETMLLNLTRGTAIRGLCGIPPKRGRIIRPLLDCTRAEIEAYCRTCRLPWVTDSTNLETVYTRNRIRHLVVPELKGINPRFEELAAGTAEALREDADCLAALAEEKLRQLRMEDGRYSRKEYLCLPPALRRRVLALILDSFRLPYGRERLQRLDAILRQGSGGMQLSGALVFACHGERFSVGPPRPGGHRRRPFPCESVGLMLPEPGSEPLEIHFCGKTVRFSTTDYENYKESLNNQQKLLKNAVDYAKIKKIAMLRLHRPSDRIRPVGRGCTKTIKNLWSETKTPPDIRRGQILLSDGERVLWSEAFGVDESVAAGEDSGTVLILEILEE